MPRKVDVAARAETAAEIKHIARQQMANNGTAGVSLRAIAREMGITAPAIYNYFPSLDDLITALLVDAFNGLGDAVEDGAVGDTLADKLRNAAHAYRQWALKHPADFQLIYGNPIPNYEAPAELTIPLARRPLETFTQILLEGMATSDWHIPPAYRTIAATIETYMQTWMRESVPPEVPAQAIYTILVMWSRIHGIIMLELFQHISPTVGDVDAFYELELEQFLDTIGVKEDKRK